MDIKTCKQCGEVKPISMFRKYYGGRKGTYRTCKACEKINSRYKYLVGKGELCNYEEAFERDKIEQLYGYQRSLGLQPPNGQGRSTTLTESLDDMLDKFKGMTEKAGPTVQIANASGSPHELTQWMLAELTEEPDYYFDEVYEQLCEKYKPCIGIDKATMMPVYDETHKAMLDAILTRFNEYEDAYYEKEV